MIVYLLWPGGWERSRPSMTSRGGSVDPARSATALTLAFLYLPLLVIASTRSTRGERCVADPTA